MEIENFIDRYFLRAEEIYISRIISAQTIKELDSITSLCFKTLHRFESKFNVISNTDHYEKKKCNFVVTILYEECVKAEALNLTAQK